MSEHDLVGLFVALLQRLGLDYMVTGGVAAVAYGDPRFTRDVDIVLALARSEVGSFAEAFSGPDFYLPPREVLTEEISRRKSHRLHRTPSLECTAGRIRCSRSRKKVRPSSGRTLEEGLEVVLDDRVESVGPGREAGDAEGVGSRLLADMLAISRGGAK